MSHNGPRGDELQAIGYNEPGPKKDDGTVVGGPAAPGSYPETPKRVTVRLTDPHIELQDIPKMEAHCHNSRPASQDLLEGENGTGRQK